MPNALTHGGTTWRRVPVAVSLKRGRDLSKTLGCKFSAMPGLELERINLFVTSASAWLAWFGLRTDGMAYGLPFFKVFLFVRH